jgi:hypothetical protein
MRNKFKYIADDLPKQQHKKQPAEKTHLITQFEPLKLTHSYFHYISDRKDHITKQLSDFANSLEKEHKKVKYFLMNSITQNLLRTYYSYEVNHVPKEHKFEQRINGMLLGKGIILDESLENNTIIPAQSKEIKKVRGRLEYMAMLDTEL